MSSFVLLDNSLEDLRGHNFSYAFHVLQAAQRRYQPVLATNKRFDAEVPAGWQVLPLYRYGNWVRMPRLAGVRRPGHTSGSAGAGAVVAAAARPLRRSLRSLYNRLRGRSFAESTRSLCQTLRLGTGDAVFLPNAGQVELAGLASYLESAPTGGPSWHLLFRMEPPPPDAARGDRLDGLVAALQRLSAGNAGRDVRFYSDSDSLAQAYGAFCGAHFEVLPIPHTQALTPPQPSEGRPVRIAYLGEARAEKGYTWLPGLVQELRRDPGSQRVTFLLQSDNAEADPQVMAATEELRAMEDQSVELCFGPMSMAEYAQRLQDADVVLLPYARQSYLSRTSGVLVEALSAGRPAVFPDGTWMAREAIALGADADAALVYHERGELPGLLRSVIQNYEVHRIAAAAGAQSWRKRHNAERLVSLLHAAGLPAMSRRAT